MTIAIIAKEEERDMIRNEEKITVEIKKILLKRTKHQRRGLHTTRRSKKSLNKHEETINQNVNNENVEKCCVCVCITTYMLCAR
jgi:hypothetical protein